MATLYLLDENYVLPDRGDEEHGPESPEPAGDPDEAVRLFLRYRQLMAEILGYEDELNGPAPEEEIAEVEQRLGYALPPDLRALYRIADGEGRQTNSVFDRQVWENVRSVSSVDGDWVWISQEWEREPWAGTMPSPGFPGTVRRSVNRPGWLCFAFDTGGNWLAVDMDPGPKGHPGQVIAIGGDYTDGPAYIADSVTTFFRRLVEALGRGDYRTHEKHLWINSGLKRRSGEDIVVYSDASPSFARAKAAGPHVQSVQVTDVEDCSFVAALPDVLTMTLSSDGSPDLSPLGDCAVEDLELDVGSADLTGLARNPELRSLSITCERPVDLTPLRAAPKLWKLDIAAAQVTDMAAISRLEGLRFLEVTRDQWREVSKLDDLPPLGAVAVHPVRPEREWRGRIDWDVDYDEAPEF